VCWNALGTRTTMSGRVMGGENVERVFRTACCKA
jgi:hypothetical protein